MQQDIQERARLVGGAMLITLGVLALIAQAGILTGNAMAWLWVIGFGAWAAVFAWVYVTWRPPWAILVAYIDAAIALIVLFAAIIAIGDLLPSVVLFLIAAPFVAGWWLDRRQWGLLIPAYVLGAIGVGLLPNLLEDKGNLFVAYILAVIGLPFLVGWVPNRRNWGLLIPAYVMLAIALAFLLNIFEGGNLFITYIMWVIAAPFLLAAALTRQWPFLIPGGILFVIGAFFLVGSGEALGTLISLFVAAILIVAGAILLFRAYIQQRRSGE